MGVSIPAKLHNSLIGTKGRLIRSVMEECGGVHIHFPVEGSGSDTVVIRGPSSDVEKAKKQLLHLAEEKVSALLLPSWWGFCLWTSRQYVRLGDGAAALAGRQ